MKTFALTHIGLTKKDNEDRYLVKDMADGTLLLAVADGLGGETAGEHAAEITIGMLESIKYFPMGVENILIDSVKKADTSIINETIKDPALEGMGTTLTAVLLMNGSAYWVHAGDSRFYIFRNNSLSRKTRDQTILQFLLDEGEVTEKGAMSHPARHMIDQCVGCGDCSPDSGSLDIIKGDKILLTTDGLHGCLSDSFIADILNSSTDLEKGANELLDAALKAGGEDNITIVMLQC